MNCKEIRICEVCGSEFKVRRRSNRRMCSRRCSKAYRQLHSEELKAKKKAYYQLPEVKAKMKAYRQLPEVKAKKKAYHLNYTPNYKKKAKTSEKNIKEILKKHNLSHLSKQMIFDGITLDKELKKRNLEASP